VVGLGVEPSCKRLSERVLARCVLLINSILSDDLAGLATGSDAVLVVVQATGSGRSSCVTVRLLQDVAAAPLFLGSVLDSIAVGVASESRREAGPFGTVERSAVVDDSAGSIDRVFEGLATAPLWTCPAPSFLSAATWPESRLSWNCSWTFEAFDGFGIDVTMIGALSGTGPWSVQNLAVSTIRRCLRK
jgi:hypothetical protein